MLVTRIFVYFVTFSALCILTLILKYWKWLQMQQHQSLFEAESNPVWKKLSPMSGKKVSRRQAKNGISQEDRRRQGKLNQTFPTCQFHLAETLPISVFGKKNADIPKNIPMHQVHTIRKVKFLSKNSILTKPQHFHEFFTPNFFWQFFSWIQSCQQLKCLKPQHFHEFFTPKNPPPTIF